MIVGQTAWAGPSLVQVVRAKTPSSSEASRAGILRKGLASEGHSYTVIAQMLLIGDVDNPVV